MGSIISILIAFLVNKVLNFGLKGNIFYDIISKFKQLFSNKSIVKKRFDFFDTRDLSDLKKIGVLPNDEEFDFELPNQRKNEDISIIGLNSWGQALHLKINWRPKTPNTSAINVDLCFEDGNGNTYTLNEVNLVAYDLNKREYKAPGIQLEILNPFRRLRIKFRGYLRKNGSNQLVFVRFRLLWIAISKIFDLQSDHNKQFIETEICGKTDFDKMRFEDRFEQLGQMKGRIQIENEVQEKLFLWGNKSKKYVQQCDRNRQIKRLFGFSRKGWIFHIGSVFDKTNQISYRYGFAFWGKIMIFPIDYLSHIDFNAESLDNNYAFTLSSIDKVFNIKVNKGRINTNILEIEINGNKGRAVFMDESKQIKFETSKCQIHFPFSDKTKELVLPLSDERTENVLLSGGKGSSLASLKILSKQLNNSLSIEVPNGIVVTCNAYELLVNSNQQISKAIKKLKSFVSQTDLLKKECESVVNTIKSNQLPKEIKDKIRTNLELIFGKNQLNNTLFAVRSSASGEDSEEMSAAGQMTTYLGVKGLESIYSAVMKCWSSQFEFVAVEYKRGYGQDMDSLMAIVVQEMVDCDSAGVLFTCDPLTGDERQILITANYGIGESVVSAIAEPDTIRVGVNITENSLNSRKIDGIKSKSLGSKQKCIKINDTEGGTVEIDIENKNQCCISDENSLRLANIALEIQKFYGSVRDIEWGIKNDKIFILQSRPVTNLDYNFTEFELMHELDVGLPSEMEYLSKANVGEVLPGCSSHMSLTFFMTMWAPMFINDLHEKEGLPIEIFCPYAPSDFARIYNHFFFNLKNSEFFKLGDDSAYTKGMIYAIFGHEIDDPEMTEDCKDVCGVQPLMTRFWKQFYLFPYKVIPNYFVNNYKKIVRQQRYVLDKEYSTSRELFEDIITDSGCVFIDGMTHVKTTEASSMYNHYIISLLSTEENNPHLFTDFAFLMSQCGELVSADVPSALRKLAQTIEDPKKFREFSDEEALNYLKSGNNKSSKSFNTFIETHGHRGYKEFDVLCQPWRADFLPIIKSLKVFNSNVVLKCQLI